MTQDDYDQRLAKARKRVSRMDKIDGGPVPLTMLARTALIALQSGLMTSDNVESCLFDAVVYLERLTGK